MTVETRTAQTLPRTSPLQQSTERCAGLPEPVQTLLGRTAVVLLALDDTGTSYHILVRSSFAPSLADWLLDAAIEHQP